MNGLGLRDKDYNILHLPSFYSKPKLYERFCFMNDWEIKLACGGLYPPLSQYLSRRNDDDENETLALWPEGTDLQIVCSWRYFLRIWKEYISHLKIQQPLLDTCDLCNEHAKCMVCTGMSHMETVSTFINNDPLICPESHEESLLEKGFGDIQETREHVVMLANKHIIAARAQKRFAQIKVDKAIESASATLVLDYCQNLDLPHLGGEQPADTYYFSPVWLYCLGIVDVTEGRLYAYLYDKASAKKGANDVASILLYHVIIFVIGNFRYIEEVRELNVIMDNCGGQNKNGTVIKMAAYFVKGGQFKSVNLIFLVKGHTKNNCDRNFNMLKIKWHPSNVYTFQQALDVLGEAENLNLIDSSNIHIDNSSLSK